MSPLFITRFLARAQAGRKRLPEFAGEVRCNLHVTSRGMWAGYIRTSHVTSRKFWTVRVQDAGEPARKIRRAQASRTCARQSLRLGERQVHTAKSDVRPVHDRR